MHRVETYTRCVASERVLQSISHLYNNKISLFFRNSIDRNDNTIMSLIIFGRNMIPEAAKGVNWKYKCKSIECVLL